MSEATLSAPFGALGPFRGLGPKLNVGLSSSTALKAGISVAGIAAAAAGTLGPSSASFQQHNAKADAGAGASASHASPTPASAQPVMGVTADAPPAPAPADPNHLTVGAQGPEVVKVQKAVGADADGNFGPQTRADVVTFQANHGLATDGVVGPQTHHALFDGSSKSSSSSSGSSSASYHTSSSSSSSSGGYSLPSYIVQCESQGNYHAVNSSTGAGGAYQIMPSTWRAYGGSGLPQNASKAEQDQIAGKIYAAQGSSPWSCAR